mgnify:FL=1
MSKKITCPICNKKTSLGKENSFRPFCSDRCRLIDLGEWMEENYTVSDPLIPGMEDPDIDGFDKKH